MGDVLPLTGLAGVYLVLAAVLVSGLIPASLRRLFAALTAVELIWFFVAVTLPEASYTFWGWFFDSTAEQAGSALLSSVQLVAIGLVALVIARWVARGWQRLYWGALAGVFVFLGIDEYYALHESVLIWRTLYVLVGAGLAGSSVLVFWRGPADMRRLIVPLAVGLLVMGFAGVWLDAFANQHVITVGDISLEFLHCSSRRGFLGVACQRYGILEEFLEMAGETLVLLSLLAVLYRRLPLPGRHQKQRMVAVGSAIWGLWLVSSLWVAPALETVVGTQPARIDYLDGALSLSAYTVPAGVVAPGDPLNVTLYLRAGDFLGTDYSVSLQLWSQPTIAVLAQHTMQLGEWRYPTRAWIPGLPVRNRFHLQLPEDIETPASYWLVARVWEDDIDDGVAVTASDRRLFDPEVVILDSIPVLAEEIVTVPAELASDYQFADQFSLAGYKLPSAETGEALRPGSPLTFRFWWHTEADVESDLTQFLHLFHSNGEDVGVFDRATFAGRFPTQDWPGGMTVEDEWTITLPEEFPAGEYRVHTGLYDSETKDRMAVVDSAGQTVQDFSIVLGTVVLDEGE